MTIIITTDTSPSTDTLCSMLAYAHFLEQQNQQVKCCMPDEYELSELQEEIIKMCNIEIPTLKFDDIDENNCEFILVNINSLTTLNSKLNSNNIAGIIANATPEHFEHIEENEFGRIHIEEKHNLSTLIVEKFKLTQTPIEQSYASLLLLGIILSSNGLEEEYTTNRDFVAVEYVEQFSNIRKDQINALVNQL